MCLGYDRGPIPKDNDREDRVIFPEDEQFAEPPSEPSTSMEADADSTAESQESTTSKDATWVRIPITRRTGK